jgi:hypothetical protein
MDYRIVRPAAFFALGFVGVIVGRAEPSVREIISKTLANDDVRQQALRSMQYDQTATVDQLNSHEEVTRHDVLTMIISPGAHSPMNITSVSGDGAPALSDHAAVQGMVDDVEGNKATFTLHDLADRLIITRAGDDTLDGTSVYLLAFAPKPALPWRDDTEKVVNQLRGRVWISKSTYNVLRTEAALTHPVHVAWFLATVPTLRFEYRTHDSKSGFADSQERITLEVRALFVGYHERQIIRMSRFRATTPR